MFSASLPDLNALDLEAVKALLVDRHESYTATLNSRTSEIGMPDLLYRLDG